MVLPVQVRALGGWQADDADMRWARCRVSAVRRGRRWRYTVV
jgi:hypothetical protein